MEYSKLLQATADQLMKLIDLPPEEDAEFFGSGEYDEIIIEGIENYLIHDENPDDLIAWIMTHPQTDEYGDEIDEEDTVDRAMATLKKAKEIWAKGAGLAD